jgi:hypothetical protein
MLVFLVTRFSNIPQGLAVLAMILGMHSLLSLGLIIGGRAWYLSTRDSIQSNAAITLRRGRLGFLVSEQHDAGYEDEN